MEMQCCFVERVKSWIAKEISGIGIFTKIEEADYPSIVKIIFETRINEDDILPT